MVLLLVKGALYLAETIMLHICESDFRGAAGNRKVGLKVKPFSH